MGFLDATVTIRQKHGGIMSAFRRASVRWRRVAHGLIVIGSHIALYLVSRLRIGAKTLGMCEGFPARLDPQFRMTEAIMPYVVQLLASRPSDAGGV
jgi:hypothetical protein